MDSLLSLNMQYLALCLTENLAVLYMMTILFLLCSRNKFEDKFKKYISEKCTGNFKVQVQKK